MRNVYFTIMAAFILCGTCVGCSAETAQQGGSKEVALVLVKGVAGQAQGKLVIDTANGTDLTIRISGLDPKGLYTAFFVNTKSKMFEGIGPAPPCSHGQRNRRGGLQDDHEKGHLQAFRASRYLPQPER